MARVTGYITDSLQFQGGGIKKKKKLKTKQLTALTEEETCNN